MDFTAKARLRATRSGNVRPPGFVPNGELAARRAFLKGSASVLLVSGFGSSLLAACGGGGVSSSDLPDTPRLASVDNFRDIGGAGGGYPTVDGRQVRRGVFYRSNALTLSTADKAVIDTLNIGSVYDLRTPGEVARSADVMPAGAAYVNINVTGESDNPMPPPQMPGGAIAWMESAERAYVTGAAQRAGYGAVLSQLADTPGVQLVHSTAGKDRTGWVAALLLSIANVPLDVIMQDYLLTNTYSAVSIGAQVAAVQTQSGAAALAQDAPLYSVQESFLQAGFDQVQASYGTMSSYLTVGLGLSQATIDTLHDRLVV
ncbi:tyrosine-protein phosphatase [Paraburkholderia phenazinium]|jgi:protein-tyrosine phosphatase|uniref:Protein-tyrosine phosphatase n=1 Tax=Paraburkholderia phenazinium TaxID=60549 RepID=A0A1G8KVT0_9BURK|nr:tyrosine-protein phosphatase [Paraburkholderia phenazinium]SDI47457.1 protein-tyrosine phosphatase [Paraburkholderia phenazinium]